MVLSMCFQAGSSVCSNNAINADSKKGCDEGAPLFTAGYGER